MPGVILRLSICLVAGFALLGGDVDLSRPASGEPAWSGSVQLMGTVWAGKKRDRASARNKADCEAWCQANENCAKCSRQAGCGSGYKKIKSWTGYGDNYYACARNRRGQATDQNKAACRRWCAGNKKCAYCTTQRGCGAGYKKMKSWTGRGKNYHACKKNGSINRIWPGSGAAQKEHRVLVVAAGGSGASSSDDGIEWFCEDFLRGGQHSNILCISSWGNISTSSRTLSDNIASLADAIKKKNGQEPKIILIGKSMGACKLHHAASGAKSARKGRLKNKKIDLFVGIDMSCGVDRHFQKGKRDALYFKDNVKKLIVFYQDKPGERQTGSQGIFKGKDFDKNIHINVNQDGFSLARGTKLIRHNKKGMCPQVGHREIDDCEELRETISKLIIKQTR